MANHSGDSKSTTNGPPRLTKIAHRKVVEHLRERVSKAAAPFMCGGTINVLANQDVEKMSGIYNICNRTYPPIQIRFDSNSIGRKLSLPTGQNLKELQELVSCCSAVDRGEDHGIPNDSLQNVGQLDPSDFMTDFCPHRAGIVDVLSQLLNDGDAGQIHWGGIRCELRNLHVYGGLGASLKPAARTTQSNNRFGTLVVALPTEHQGGRLVIHDDAGDTDFDWSTNSLSTEALGTNGSATNPSFRWVAFDDSNCQYEVLDVNEGHLVTLTYTLYDYPKPRPFLGSPSVLDPTKFPLYEPLKEALNSPGFLQRGRILAYWLTCSYSHTHQHATDLPNCLKGTDLAVYEAARALDMDCRIHPIIKPNSIHRFFCDCSYMLIQPEFETLKEGSFLFYPDVGHENDPDGEHDYMKNELGAQGLEKRKVTWLNKLDTSLEEPAFAYPWFDEPEGYSMYVKHSAVALLIRIPPANKPEQTPPTDIFEGIESDEEEDYESEDDSVPHGPQRAGAYELDRILNS